MSYFQLILRQDRAEVQLMSLPKMTTEAYTGNVMSTKDKARLHSEFVSRPKYENARFVQELLEFLATAAPGCAPIHRGFDAEGREQLSFVVGETVQTSLLNSTQTESLGRLLRRLHDATNGSSLTGQAEIVQHGDPGPQNCLFLGNDAVAYIDWEYAHPGTRLEELGELVWGLVETRPSPEDDTFQLERIASLCHGYGGPQLQAVLDETSRQVEEAHKRYGPGSKSADAHFATVEQTMSRLHSLSAMPS